jgi:hypothetical protein
VTEKPEHLLGRVLDETAARRGVHGPYNVADYIRQETEEGPGGSAWSQIFSGSTYRPRREVLLTFARAFKLSPEELQRLAHVFTFDKELPEGVEVPSEYADLAAQIGWTESPLAEAAHDAGELPDTAAVEMPSEWVGERVRAFMEADEEVQGTLLGVTAHGIVIDVGARRQQGPCFYSWQMVRWMYPVDRQTINESR